MALLVQPSFPIHKTWLYQHNLLSFTLHLFPLISKFFSQIICILYFIHISIMLSAFLSSLCKPSVSSLAPYFGVASHLSANIIQSILSKRETFVTNWVNSSLKFCPTHSTFTFYAFRAYLSPTLLNWVALIQKLSSTFWRDYQNIWNNLFYMFLMFIATTCLLFSLAYL